MDFLIELNIHDGLSWKIDLNTTDYEILSRFINQVINTKYKYIEKKKNIIVGNGGYNTRVTKDDIDKFNLLLTSHGKTCFEVIKTGLSNGNKELIIKSETIKITSYSRLLIYLLCKIFGLNFETIKEVVPVLIPCTDFLPCNKNKPRSKHITTDIQSYGNDDDDDWDIVCGCDFAPNWFDKNHVDNNYEDTISYSRSYRTRKTGVRVYFS